MKAQFYTYRNLNFGKHFSVKHMGKVSNYVESAHIKNGNFQVSEASRQRCLTQRRRNVHAFIVSAEEPAPILFTPGIPLIEVSYNPYRGGTFYVKSTGDTVLFASDIYLLDGRAFIPKEYN